MFNPDIWKELIDLQSAAQVEDNNGLKYSLIRTKEKRASEICGHFNRHDAEAPEGMKIKVTSLFGYDKVISFKKGEDPNKHAVYKTMAALKDTNSSTYKEWNRKVEHMEYDVVKKRKIMDTVPGDDANETCPEALKRFEDFEASVLEALIEINIDDTQSKNNELLQMEQDLCSGIKPTKGCVYVAVSKAVKYPKIGATRKSHPSARLRELSRYVPSPFEAVFWVPTIMPFKTEADIHRHFAALRIKEKGACTEFFDVDIETVGAYLKATYDVQEQSDICSQSTGQQ